MVSIASLCPIVTVQILALILAYTKPLEEILLTNLRIASAKDSIPLLEAPPLRQFIYGLRSILPSLAALLLLLMFMKLSIPYISFDEAIMEEKTMPNIEDVDLDGSAVGGATPKDDTEPASKSVDPVMGRYSCVAGSVSCRTGLPNGPNTSRELAPRNRTASCIQWCRKRATFLIGVALTQIGIILFNYGIDFGFAALGQQAGTTLPSAFVSTTPGVAARFSYGLGLFIVLLFIFILALLATHAEPALYVFAKEVQFLTRGRLKSVLLICTISLGVGVGLLLGILSIIFSLNMGIIMIVTHVTALVYSLVATESVVAVAWDSGGITTGILWRCSYDV